MEQISISYEGMQEFMFRYNSDYESRQEELTKIYFDGGLPFKQRVKTLNDLSSTVGYLELHLIRESRQTIESLVKLLYGYKVTFDPKENTITDESGNEDYDIELDCMAHDIQINWV